MIGIRIFNVWVQHANLNPPYLILISHRRICLSIAEKVAICITRHSTPSNISPVLFGAIVFGTHNAAVIILHIHIPTKGKVFGIAQANGRCGLLFHRVQSRHNDSHQHRDNRNNHKKLYQGKAFRSAHNSSPLSLKTNISYLTFHLNPRSIIPGLICIL